MKERTQEEDVVDVKRAIGRFGRAFASLDIEGLRAVWDDEYEVPVYQPEETATPFLSQEAVQNYFENLPKVISKVTDIEPLDFRVDVIGDFAHAFSCTRAKVYLNNRPEPLVGEVKQSFVLRKRDGVWRLIHHHESRLSPIFE